MLAGTVLAACGGEEESESSEATPGEDPALLRTAVFTNLATTGTALTKSEAKAIYDSLDLGNFRTSSSLETCLRSKAPFNDAVGDEAASTSAQVDVTSCYAADAFAPLTEVTVMTRAILRASLTVNEEGRYLVGRDLEFINEDLKSGATTSFVLTTFNQRVTEISGTLDGKPVLRVERSLSQNGDGTSCVKMMAPTTAEGRVQTLPCARFFARTVTTDGTVTENVVAIIRNDATIESDEYRSLNFVRDAHMKVAINDWAGEVVYGGAIPEPQYRLAKGEETLESERFGEFEDGLLDVQTAASRGGCYVGTTDCDVEITFVLNHKPKDFDVDDYEVAYAYAEGTTPPAACTPENTTTESKAAITTETLMLAGVKSRTTFAIRVCVRDKVTDTFSPGAVTYATTPELIDD